MFCGVTDSSHIYVEQNNVLRVVTTKRLSDVATFNKAPSSLAAVTTKDFSRNLYRSKFWGRIVIERFERHLSCFWALAC